MEQPAAAGGDQVVGERGLAVIDVGEDAYVPDLLGIVGIAHLLPASPLSKRCRIERRRGKGAPANSETKPRQVGGGGFWRRVPEEMEEVAAAAAAEDPTGLIWLGLVLLLRLRESSSWFWGD